MKTKVHYKGLCLKKRLWLAWKFRMWPWHIPVEAKYLSRRKPTISHLERGKQLARGIED